MFDTGSGGKEVYMTMRTHMQVAIELLNECRNRPASEPY
jgi:hypothetical protein